jgi:hypothetical protein
VAQAASVLLLQPELAVEVTPVRAGQRLVAVVVEVMRVALVLRVRVVAARRLVVAVLEPVLEPELEPVLEPELELEPRMLVPVPEPQVRRVAPVQVQEQV